MFGKKALNKNNDFILVTVSTIIASAISFAYTIIARKYIPPLEYGIYSKCLLLQTYLTYGQLGVLNAYNRDYPQLIGAGDSQASVKLKNTTFSFVCLCYFGLFCIVSLFLTIVFVKTELGVMYYVGYIMSVLMMIFNTVSDFGTNTMRMNGSYNFTSVVVVIRTIVGCGISLYCITKIGYYGLFVYPILSGIIAIALYYSGAFKDIKLHIDKAILKSSFMSGMPLMINSLVWTAVASVDKFVIIFFMDDEALGIYSIAQLGFSIMVLVPQSMSQVFYIKISSEFGRTGDKMELVRLCNKYTMINSFCTSVVCVMGYYMLPVLVRLIMPKYADGIVAAQIILIGVAIYGSTILYGNIFSVLRMNKDLLWTSIMLCVFNVVLSAGLVLGFGRKIENVAWGTSLSYVLFSVMLIVVLSHKLTASGKEMALAAWVPISIILVPTMIVYFAVSNIIIGMLMSCAYISAILIRNWIKNGNFLVLYSNTFLERKND